MLALLALAAMAQSTWYIDAAAAPPGSGTLAAPYARIDYALTQPNVVDGDTLSVEPGVYLDERMELGARGVSIVGSPGAGEVVLVGSGAASILTARGAASPVRLAHLTFQRGRGELAAFHGGTVGGALRTTDTIVVIEDCIFEDCTADFGGAISAHSITGDVGSLVIRDSEFRDSCGAAVDGGAIHSLNGVVRVFDSTVRGHAAGGRGGALFCEALHPADRKTLELVDSSFEGTSYGDGGAIYTMRSQPLVEGCSVSGQCVGDGRGGCMFALYTAFSSYSDSIFQGGRALWGGGLFGHNLRIDGCTFLDNATWSPLSPGSSGGGAIYSADTGVVEASLFRGNRASHHPRAVGGAIFGRATVDRCTFVDNDAALDGGAFFSLPNSHSVVHLRRSIVMRAAGSATPLLKEGTIARNNVIEGGFGNLPGNLDEDPLFWGPNDFHLLPGSPAIRQVANGLDKGAFPFDPHWCGEGCDGPLGQISCAAEPNWTGHPAAITALGSTDVAVDRVVFSLTQIPSNQPALLIASQQPGFVPHAGGNGTLCLGGTILRFRTEPMTYFGSTITYRAELAEFPGNAVVQAGQSWFFQFWYRDVEVAGLTSNFSPALRIGF